MEVYQFELYEMLPFHLHQILYFVDAYKNILLVLEKLIDIKKLIFS